MGRIPPNKCPHMVQRIKQNHLRPNGSSSGAALSKCADDEILNFRQTSRVKAVVLSQVIRRGLTAGTLFAAACLYLLLEVTVCVCVIERERKRVYFKSKEKNVKGFLLPRSVASSPMWWRLDQHTPGDTPGTLV